MEKLAVESPVGVQAVRVAGIAPRVPDLNRATVGEVWNGVFKGDATFPLIRSALRARYPNIRIAPFESFPHVPGADSPSAQRDRARLIAALAREKGCDAVIAGNGA
jgi:hypothetical protein